MAELRFRTRQPGPGVPVLGPQEPPPPRQEESDCRSRGLGGRGRARGPGRLPLPARRPVCPRPQDTVSPCWAAELPDVGSYLSQTYASHGMAHWQLVPHGCVACCQGASQPTTLASSTPGRCPPLPAGLDVPGSVQSIEPHRKGPPKCNLFWVPLH